MQEACTYISIVGRDGDVERERVDVSGRVPERSHVAQAASGLYTNERQANMPSGQGEAHQRQFLIGGRAREPYVAGAGEIPAPTVESGWEKAVLVLRARFGWWRYAGVAHLEGEFARGSADAGLSRVSTAIALDAARAGGSAARAGLV
jgi:hypothetical protein